MSVHRKLFSPFSCVLPHLTLMLVLLVTGNGCYSSCSFFGLRSDDEEIAYILTLHQPVRPGSDPANLIRPLASGIPNHDIWVRVIPLISSKQFRSASVEESDDGTVALKLDLDNHGRFLWMTLCAEFGGSDVAVVVDGIYRFMWKLPRPSKHQARQIVIEGNWDVDDVRAIAEWAPKNYERWHGD
jgi:hypothetical protein